MGKQDREIIAILKDVFQLNFVKPMKSDHHLRIWMIRMAFAVSVIVISMRGILGLTGHEITPDISLMSNTSITFFFTLLFLHINNEMEGTSIIMFVLTWLSLILAVYV